MSAAAAPRVLWKPHPGPQTRFLGLTTFEALYGGAAGGGKSSSLVIDAIRYLGRGYGKNYTALLLRRTYPELEGSILKETWKIYPFLGGKYLKQEKTWRFPGGEEVRLGHCQYDHDVHDYQGAELQYVGWDELTHFSEYQYTYLISRLRTTVGVPLRLRAASNPGGEGHEWVFKRFRPWLDTSKENDGPRAGAGERLWFLQNEGGTADECVPKGTTRQIAMPSGDPLTVTARSRTFIAARVSDNPSVGQDYVSNLYALDAVTRAQLLGGDWLAHAAKGAYFKRTWFHTIGGRCARCSETHIVPSTWKRRVRYWDRAATEAKQGTDPDWTVGARMLVTPDGYAGPRYLTDDVVRLRGTPQQVEATIRATATLDTKATEVWLEQDPGQAGKFEIAYYVDALRGFRVQAKPVMKDKITRAGPVSSQVEHGNVGLVMGGRWVEPFVQELEAFPEGAHDDQVDATSGAFSVVAEAPPARGNVTFWPSM